MAVPAKLFERSVRIGGGIAMDSSAFQAWLTTNPLWMVGLALFATMCVAAAAGTLLQQRRVQNDKAASSDGQEGYIVSAVLGLLALLLGFTFSLAVDRFETRRHLVLEEANAIGTAYLRAQLLPEPHRARTTGILVRYTDNRILLAQAKPGQNAQLLATNDSLLTDLWAATAAAFDDIKRYDFSSTYVDSINALIDLDASRKTARLARVPAEVFVVLFVYLVTTAGVLGYVLRGYRGRLAAGFLLFLLTLSLLLIIDIDRPTGGGIVESQRPMLELRKSMDAQPPQIFDRWRTPVLP
jgi:hypothetical protein